MMPMKSANTVNSGMSRAHANSRGTTRWCSGCAPSDDSASTCSVTRIVPSSAAIALPTRPASMVAASTGPSSRTIVMLMTEPSRVARPMRWNWLYVWTAITMPMNMPVTATTGTLRTPIE
jgi:hypothetical protein